MTVRFMIDGHPVEVENGTTILQAARQKGIYIPTLCDLPTLPPHGSCRLCIVEIEGSSRTPTACTTPAQEGMAIQTNTPRLAALRSDLLRLLLSEHPLSCLVCSERDHCEECMVTLRKAGVTTGCGSCSKDGLCELQSLVDTIGLGNDLHPTRYRGVPVECGDPFFDRDYNLCVLCGRCVRVCEDLHFTGTLTYTNRGSETLVGTAYGRSHIDAGCSFCGSCVEVCPTGALSEKTRKWDGVPEREIESTCVLCGLGCSLRLLTKKNIVIGSLPLGGHLCVKGRFGITELVSHPFRLAAPQHGVEGRGMAVGWDEAVASAVKRLAECPPDGFAMHVSTDLCSEDLYVAQKFTRLVMGTNQVTTPARDSYGSGLSGVARLLKDAAPLDALKEADAILCLGLDTRFAQSVVETWLMQAQQRGAKLYTIHPNQHSLSFYADQWLQHKPGQLTTVLTTLIRLMDGETVADTDEDLCHLADALREADTLAVLIGPEALHQPDNGLLVESIERLAQRFRASVIPLMAEGNMIGSLLAGAYPELLPGGIAISDGEQRQRVGRLWGCALPELASAGEPSLLYLIGVQPPASTSATVIYQNIDQPLDGQHVDLTLPTAAFSEIDGTVVNSEGQVLPLRRAVQAPGESLPSWQILCRIAEAMNVPGFDYTSVADIQAEMAMLIEGYRPGVRVSMDALSPAFQGVTQPGKTPESFDGKGPFVLATQVALDTYMGFPMTWRVEGLRDLAPVDTLFMNPEDAAQAGIEQGDEVAMRPSHNARAWPVCLDHRQQPGTLRLIVSERDSDGSIITPVEIRKTHVQTD